MSDQDLVGVRASISIKRTARMPHGVIAMSSGFQEKLCIRFFFFN